MQKQTSTLRLPKIDDFTSQKGYRNQQPQGFLSPINGSTKASRLYQDSNERSSYIPQMNGFDKQTRSYGNLKDEKLFAETSNRQAYMLKKLEAQQESLQKNAQYLGIGQTIAAKATPKADQFSSLRFDSPTNMRKGIPEPMGLRSSVPSPLNRTEKQRLPTLGNQDVAGAKADSDSPMLNKTLAKPAVSKKSGMIDSPARRAPEPAAFLPPAVPKAGKENKPLYTLVLDMDETLIHFEEVAGRGRFFVRPHAEEFLKEMSEIFEIVVFTAGVQEYADAVLNILDPNRYISHRLYRQHVSINDKFPGIVKDLSKIGRDLTKTILVDNAPENFRPQLDNGIEIISWYNDPCDVELASLKPFLKDLVENQIADVRTAVRLLRENRRLNKH